MSGVLTKQLAKKAQIAAGLYRRQRKQSKVSGKGIVRNFVSGNLMKVAGGNVTPGKLIQIMEVGLPVNELDDLQQSLAVSVEKLAEMVGISKATFHRHKGSDGKLELVTADRVVRYARLMGKANEVFDDEEDARKWLKSPQIGLSGAIPLDYAKTEIGAREVENLLGRIEYGVYS
jgi:putative toxin-antitoxin system antitoxin component (TIGR02293 family)